MTTPTYTPQNWVNGSGGGTPINAPRLLHMEQGIANAEETLVSTGMKNANYNAQPNDFIPADMSASAWAIQLPTAPPNGTTVAVKVMLTGNALSINRGGTDVFNIVGGSTQLQLFKKFQSVLLEYYSGIWYVSTEGFPPDFMGVQATVSANGTAVEAWHNPFDATGGARAATLPTPTGPGKVISIEKVDTSANVVTVVGTIDGVAATTLVLAKANESIFLTSKIDGSWWRTAGHKRTGRVARTNLTASVTTAATTIGDVTGGTITFTAEAGATYELRAKMYVSNNTAADGVVVALTDNSNVVLDTSPTIVSRTAGDQFLVVLQADVSPAAGAVTYKLRFNAVTGGTASINASATQVVTLTATRVS